MTKYPTREIRIVPDYACDLCGSEKKMSAVWEAGDSLDAVICIDCTQRLMLILEAAQRAFK